MDILGVLTLISVTTISYFSLKFFLHVPKTSTSDKSQTVTQLGTGRIGSNSNQSSESFASNSCSLNDIKYSKNLESSVERLPIYLGENEHEYSDSSDNQSCDIYTQETIKKQIDSLQTQIKDLQHTLSKLKLVYEINQESEDDSDNSIDSSTTDTNENRNDSEQDIILSVKYNKQLSIFDIIIQHLNITEPTNELISLWNTISLKHQWEKVLTDPMLLFKLSLNPNTNNRDILLSIITDSSIIPSHLSNEIQQLFDIFDTLTNLNNISKHSMKQIILEILKTKNTISYILPFLANF